MNPTPFQIDVAEEDLADLRQRLSRTRWPDQLAGIGWAQGTELAFLKELVEDWGSRYDWRLHEKELNTFAQYIAEIDSLRIHYVHEHGTGPHPLPIILGHSCFSNFYEFHDLIRRLTDPQSYGGSAEDSFDVVAWSLPGFGFSSKPTEAGLGCSGMAEIAQTLMTDVLGYEQYGALGGSWGGLIAVRLGFVHPDSLIALFLTQANPPARPVVGSGERPLSEREVEFVRLTEEFRKEGHGYQDLLTTRPQSLAYALNDSPAGVAGWTVEKLRDWSDCHGDLGSTFTRDEILTSISITWFTQTVASGQRLYWEMKHGDWMAGPGETIDVPVGVLGLPGGIPNEKTPPETLRRKFTDLRYYEMAPRGGHFPGLEIPAVLADHVRAFYRPFRAN